MKPRPDSINITQGAINIKFLLHSTRHSMGKISENYTNLITNIMLV